MNVKVIGVNPINPEISKMITEATIEEGKGLHLKFRTPLSELKIRLLKGGDSQPELVLFLGTTISKDKYLERSSQLKKMIEERKKGNGLRAPRSEEHTSELQ